MLGDGICTLAYFHKDSVTSYKEIKKDCNDWKRLCEKDYSDWERLGLLKKIVIIENSVVL